VIGEVSAERQIGGTGSTSFVAAEGNGNELIKDKEREFLRKREAPIRDPLPENKPVAPLTEMGTLRQYCIYLLEGVYRTKERVQRRHRTRAILWTAKESRRKKGGPTWGAKKRRLMSIAILRDDERAPGCKKRATIWKREETRTVEQTLERNAELVHSRGCGIVTMKILKDLEMGGGSGKRPLE